MQCSVVIPVDAYRDGFAFAPWARGFVVVINFGSWLQISGGGYGVFETFPCEKKERDGKIALGGED